MSLPNKTKSEDWLILSRMVRFGDTDAAGVMHFHQLLRWCHEAWEESLELYGITPSDIFPSSLAPYTNQLLFALPIIHCEADYFRPVKTGDRLQIELQPRKLDSSRFEVEFQFFVDKQQVALGLIRHCSIEISTRKNATIPDLVNLWIERSSLSKIMKPAELD